MMISRRPVSSPGQVEKYPTPFMGFLKSNSNGGSISRSRKSRASPLFVRRNKSAAAAVTQEPSSPKVTCMGQVRVKRSKPKIQPESRENPTRKRCEWIRNASFHNGFAEKIKSVSFWPKCKLFSRRKQKSEKEKDSPISQLDRPVKESIEEINEEEEEEILKIPKLFVSPATTPPINALLLTRSRSAPYSSGPYSSSSLAFRFWEENNEREAESLNQSEQNVRSETTNSEVSVGATEKMNGADGAKKVGITELGFVRQPELTRSKSAPGRIGEKMLCFCVKKKVRQGLGLSRD